MVNETTFGYAWNSYSWIAPKGEFAEDYRKYYRSAVGIDVVGLLLRTALTVPSASALAT